MNETTLDLDHTDADLLIEEVSDDALEAAAGAPLPAMSAPAVDVGFTFYPASPCPCQ